MLLIEGAELYDPQARGVCNVLVAGGEVVAIGERAKGQDVERIEGRGKLLVPGLVDALTHPCGGGGEGGFGNRTEELGPDVFLRAGVTSPVAALGTDSLGRSLEVLYGNVMGLRAAGLNAFMLTGAYRVPPPTLTGDIARDIYLIDPVVGVGEVAVADHRGSQPTGQELRRLAADAQLGGILAGAGGVVLVHVGDGDSRLALLRAAVKDCDLAPSALYPTHVNRSTALLDEAADWTLRGGFVDITVSTTPELIAAGDVPAAAAFKRLLEAGAPADRITLSSDAGGSLPLYVDGELRGLTAASPTSLPELLAATRGESPELFALVLAAMTRNPAAALRLPAEGRVVVGGTADLLLIDAATGAVDAVLCRGRCLLRDGETLKPTPAAP